MTSSGFAIHLDPIRMPNAFTGTHLRKHTRACTPDAATMLHCWQAFKQSTKGWTEPKYVL